MSNPPSKCMFLNPMEACKLDFLNNNFFATLNCCSTNSSQNEKSKAKPGQQLLVHKLNKNLLFVLISYLKCSELFSFILTTGKLYHRMT